MIWMWFQVRAQKRRPNDPATAQGVELRQILGRGAMPGCCVAALALRHVIFSHMIK